MSTCAAAPQASRNWISYLCEALISTGAMPSWEAAAYFTDNLFGEAPNPRLHESKSPYEATSLFLQRVYNPIVEAAMRAIDMPASSMIHIFTDISLIGNSAVLVVYFPGENRPHQLLLLDAARAWDLVFRDADAFNAWAEERHGWILSALQAAVARQMTTTPADELLAASL